MVWLVSPCVSTSGQLAHGGQSLQKADEDMENGIGQMADGIDDPVKVVAAPTFPKLLYVPDDLPGHIIEVHILFGDQGHQRFFRMVCELPLGDEAQGDIVALIELPPQIKRFK